MRVQNTMNMHLKFQANPCATYSRTYGRQLHITSRDETKIKLADYVEG